MLNEYREFEEYTYDLFYSGEKPERIMYSTFISIRKDDCGRLKGELKGLERFLTIIARYFIFLQPMKEIEKNNTVLRTAVKSWMGGKCGNWEKLDYFKAKEKIQKLVNWLPEYLLSILLQNKINELRGKLNKADEKQAIEIERYLIGLVMEEDNDARLKIANIIVELCKPFKMHNSPANGIKKIIITMNAVKQKTQTLSKDGNAKHLDNDYHQISFFKINSNAINDGPLKIRYLVCVADPFKNIEKGKTIKKSDVDRILKLTAACLIELSKSAGFAKDGIVRFVPVNFTDVANWTKNNGRLEYKDDFAQYRYKDMPVFEEKLVGKNVMKIKINQKWFDQCQWALIDATENDDKLDAFLRSHPNAIFYRDDGSGKELVCNERYVRDTERGQNKDSL